MYSLETLPADIVYEIIKRIDIRDTSRLSVSSSKLRRKILSLQENIILSELQKANPSMESVHLLNMFYGFLHNHLVYYIYNYRKTNPYFTLHNLKSYVMSNDFTFFTVITANPYINNIFGRIFFFYVYNNYVNLYYYPNKLDLYVMYAFLQIEIYHTTTNFDYWFGFLQSVDQTKFNDICIRYYNSLLDTFHINQFEFTFDQMKIVSERVVSPQLFKKLMGYGTLNLSTSTLHLCCLLCNEECIIDICNYKMHHWTNQTTSTNYKQFREMLKRENVYYYHFLVNRETYLVNNLIYIKNPQTNRRMRLNGNIYKTYIQTLQNDPYLKNCYETITQNISKQQHFLRNKFFT